MAITTFGQVLSDKIWVNETAGDPTVLDDANAGYLIGSRWINTATKLEYTCTDNSVGASVWTSSGEINGGVVLPASTTPPQLTANTNDWLISGLVDVASIFASTDGANYDLTGIDSTGLSNGQTYFFYNVGTNGDIKLKNNDANSLAGNRFQTNGDVVIKNGMGCIITYNTNLAIWLVNYFK